MSKTEKTRIRNEIAEEIRDSRIWLKIAMRHGDKSEIARFGGEVNAFRMAGKIIGK
jgi:hypothetical protein